MNCEPPPVDKATYFWPYLSNRKQRERLAEIQQTTSCDQDEEEDTIVEHITHDCVVESAMMNDDDDDDILCDDMWTTDTTQDISQDTATTDQDTTHCSISQHTGRDISQDTGRDIVQSPQFIIQDSSSCDLQHPSYSAQSQDTNNELSDQEVEDCIRQLIQKGVSTVRPLCCHGDT